MADIPASTWSETDADNNTAAPLGFPEGMAPSGVNNGARAVMGAVKRWFNWTIPKTTGGTTTAYTLSYSVAPAALVDGMSHLVQFNAACGASPTLNVNSLGAKPIYYYTGSAWVQVTVAGTIPANFIGRVSYNSSDGAYRITAGSFAIGAALLAVANTFAGTLTMSGKAINEAAWVDVASATTTDIGAADSNAVRITGTTAITGLGTAASGVRRKLRFAGALTLTHNATSLILQTAANITTAADDTADALSLGSGNWLVSNYARKNGTPLALAMSPITAALGADVAMPSTGTYYTGPSIAQGSSGTWFVSGSVTVANGTGGDIVNVKLWDGTTVIASCRMHLVSVAGTYYGVVGLSGYIAAPAGNLRISVSPFSRTEGVIAFNASGNSKDSTITAIRIA